MKFTRSLVPLAAALVALTSTGTAAGPEPACLVDVGNALAQTGSLKIADVTPLAEGTWHGDVFVLPYAYPETYDRRLPSGSDNVQARQWVAQSFFAHNPDVYDFIAVITGFTFDAGWSQPGDPTHALYWGVRNDAGGIGLDFFDHSQVFGSHRLQGYIDANGLDLVRDTAGNLDADLLLTVLGHELGHRWLAYCDYLDAQGAISSALRGVDDTHWSYLLDSDASYMYGADWRDNGDGSFTATEIKARYSDLDLYLMGMLASDEVEPFTLLVQPSIPADQVPELNATVNATPVTATVADVIAAEGSRTPAAADAPHELRIALVYLTAPDAQPSADELDFLAAARDTWRRRFFAQTEGRGVIGVGRNNLPVVSPPTLDLASAIDWLLAETDASGLWQDDPMTRGRDSAAAITAVDLYGGHPTEVAAALDALASDPAAATEIEAWQADPLARNLHPQGAVLLDELSSWVLAEGAWGGGLRYAGDPVTTARVARALAAGGRHTDAGQALGWVVERQNGDGGWSWRDGGPSAVAPTLEAIGAIVAVDSQSWNEPPVQNGVAWLLARRTQGGFGEPHPDVAQTADFLAAAVGQGVTQDIINDAITFLAARQRSDGSWNGSVYETARAVAALTPFVQPDLAVESSELLVEPENPFVEDQLSLVAAVHALNGDVAAGAGYRWEAIDGAGTVVATLNGVLPPIPATLFATVSDTWNLQYQVSPGAHTFRFMADPNDEIAEADESNNTAELGVTFRNHTGGVDLELTPDAVQLNPDVIGAVPQTVVIDGIVRNTGWSEARDAVIGVFEPGVTVPISSTTTTVPANGEAAFQLTIQIQTALPTPLAVIADPDNLLNDADPTNNRIDLELGVAQVFDPALVPGSLIVDPATGIEAGDPLTISFDVVNHGTQPLSPLQVGVSYTAGDPPATTPLQLLDLVDVLAPGNTTTLTFDWRPPVADPSLTLDVEIDPSHLVEDADRDNNSASVTLAVAPSPLPNLVADHARMAFDPEPALQHQTVHITATVDNPSDNPSGAFMVRIWIDEIGSGLLVGEAAVATLSAGDSTIVEADWTVDEMTDRLVWVDVDPDGQVAEFNEEDNQDFAVLDVSTIADLVVTSGQVSVDPRFPPTGATVEIDVAVLNTGDQPASDVGVELAVVGGAVVATTTIPLIAGGEAETASFNWATDGVVGDVTLRATVDPDDTVNEIDETNNAVEVTIAVQDDDLWVTERYISPDGDGVKDTTTIFVREGVDTVEIVDPWGELAAVVEVDNAGQAVWDGRRDNGGAVRDGVYEIRANGLTTWVEVDLNAVTITDDVRQPLVIGSVSPLSSLPGARFTSGAISPVDGIFYLTEKVSSSPYAERMIRRWDGNHLATVPDWPQGQYTTIRQLSADESVFVTWNFTYSLLRFPGPQTDPLPPPGSTDTPHLSPNGDWILWTDTRAFQPEKSFFLQRTDDLGSVVEIGPYPSGSPWGWPVIPTVHWAPDGRRFVATLFSGSSSRPGHAVDVTLGAGQPPSVRELALDQSCSGQESDITGLDDAAATVDFDSNIVLCIDEEMQTLRRIDLQTGAAVDSIALPNPGFGDMVWYRLSNDGRAVEIDEHVIPLAKRTEVEGHLLYDWQRGIDTPWFEMGLEPPPLWSTFDRYWFADPISGVSVLSYRTPTANLVATLDPVVRFGGAGIDLFLTVTDRNLDIYQLEFAPASDPDAFEPLGQPSRGTIFGESWGTWIPPAQGDWRVRLTAVDLAGNRRSSTRWVSWNGVSDIAGLWTESRYISPVSSPGVQDHLIWQYTVLRPSQLLFEIVDASGTLLRSIPVGASQPGPATTVWDGLDDAGRPVPDGDYRLVFRGAEWPVTVDNTPPTATFDIADNGVRPTADEIDEASGWSPPVELARSALFNHTAWSVADANLDRTVFESRPVDQVDWAPVSGDVLFAGVTSSDARAGEVRAEWWSERLVRQVADDRAGNRSVAERLHREEQLAFAIAEPPCRSDDEPCIFPDRPDVDALHDADGLMDQAVAVLWPDYSTLLVQSTVWGDWRDTLRLEFRTPADGGLPPGDWQPGTLTLSDQPVWRRSGVLTGNPVRPTATLSARVLPVYWEHPSLPLRPYELRLVAENRDGDTVVSPTTLMVPKAPLAVEYLSTDAGGDHFRVHNIGAVQIDDIVLQGSGDAVTWLDAAPIGSLDPGLSTLVSTGCAFHEAAIDGVETHWIRVVGVDPWQAQQASLPAPFQRGGPPRAASRPSFTLVRAECPTGSPPAMGMMGYNPDAGGLAECTSWSCELGWFSAGNLVDLRIEVPGVDPNGTPIAGYELLIDGNPVAGAPNLVPGGNGRVILDLANLPEGDHVVSERYLFAPGDDGMLASCVQDATLRVDRSAALAISNPTDGQSLCPDQGVVPIVYSAGEVSWRESFLIDGSTTGITVDPATHGPAISVPLLTAGLHQLDGSMVDLAGNTACVSVEFVSENVAAVAGLETEPPVFSPVNTTGRPTETVISFGSTANATWIAEIRDELGDEVLVADGAILAGETVSLAWDGTSGGGPVADGVYRIWIRLVSDCGAIYETPEPLSEITVDTEGPTLIVTSPSPGSWTQTALELSALIEDPHFESWEARIKPQPPEPGDWIVFASGDQPSADPNNVLARWPTANLAEGSYIVEVEAADRPGNHTISEAISITAVNPELIASLEAEPIYFSPNGDGVADTTEFSFELLAASEVYLGYEGQVDLIPYLVLPAGIIHTATWDGLDDAQNPAPDGAYRFTLDATEPNSGDWESDGATVLVDRVPPDVVLSSPADGTLTALPVTVTGYTGDLHSKEHTVTLINPDGSVTELADGAGDWNSGAGFVLDDLADGQYRVRVEAVDKAENATTVEHDFVVDNTAPTATITAPETGRVLDPAIHPFVLRGTIAAAHPQSYGWWIAEGADPQPGDFVLVFEAPLASGGEVEQLWTGPPPADGVHTVRLTVLDELGRSSEDRRAVTIDSAEPVVELWTPPDGTLVTEPTAISGRVNDANLAHWTVEEIGAGGTRLLAAGASPAENHLIDWDPLPDDGAYVLRLTAADHAGHTAESTVNVDVSVQPPGRPVGLTAAVVNGRDAELAWQQGPGPAPVGYHVERNGVRITAALISQPAFTDLQLLDGAHAYAVVAVGPLGRESDPSEPATIVVNTTPPSVALTSPAPSSQISSEVPIHGTAFAADDFAFWEITARPTGSSGWVVLDSSTAPVIGGFMTSWITHLAPWSDGPHELRLAAEDVVGNRAEVVVAVTLDNTAPDPGPANLQATLLALDPDGLANDVRLSWEQTPAPPDLAGFYLYRNGFLANAGGPIVGDPTPYLLPGTSHDDKDVADGSYTYGVAAADTAGNVSAFSNLAGPITVDVHRPHAVIAAPDNLTRFEGAVEITAECADDDLVSLDLQYRLASNPDWTPVAPSFTAPPYIAQFIAPDIGTYQVRALAADAVGPDPTPHTIEIEAVDLPPAAPPLVSAAVAGGDVTLTWIAPPDPGDDLAGFEIERNGQPITGELIPPGTIAFIDAGVTDGTHSYRVVAVDDAGQRGASDAVAVLVTTPFWAWLDGVTHSDTATVTGGGAQPFGTVEIQAATLDGGVSTVGIVDADEDGVFVLEDAAMSPGANSLTAVSTDDNGNTSRVSIPLLVVSHLDPNAPEDLGATAVGSDVTVNWTAPPDPESAGFEVARSGSVINETVSAWPFDPATDSLSATDGDPTEWSLVVDGDPSTGWASTSSPSMGVPERWSWTWPETVEIDEIVVAWSPTYPPQLFDVDVLTGGGWLWLSSTSWNGQPTMIVPAGVTATGVRIRIPVTGSCGSSACIPELDEVTLSRRERTTGTSHFDPGLATGAYSYEVRQRNIWGQWSAATTTTVAVGPDQPAPPTDLAVNAVDCNGLTVQWSPAASQPGVVTGYRVYGADAPGGGYVLTVSVGANQTFAADPNAPVGTERHYVVTTLVNLAGVIVESTPSASASGTAVCANPPPPVITYPTIAGQPIQIDPSQVPIWVRGNAVPGSTITLLHDGVPVQSTTASSIFTFLNVDVRPGTNSFVARQELWGTTIDSAPIVVELDPSLFSDLEAVSLVVTPAASAPGEMVMVEGVVELATSSGGAEIFDVVFEMTDSTGASSEIYRTVLSLQPGETATVRAPWTATGPAGLIDWRMTVDPDDIVVETDEANNSVAATARVLEGEGLELVVAIDRPSYLVGQQLTGTVFFASADPPEDYLLETRLEDSTGGIVALLDAQSLTSFGGAWLEVDLDSPLIGLYPGLYRVRSVATVDGTTVAESLAAFVLATPTFVEATVSTDRSSYPEGDPVSVTGRIRNLGPTFVNGLEANLGVVDESTGLTVAHTVVHDITISAGGDTEIGWIWSSAGAATGPYRAEIVVSDTGGAPLAVGPPFSFTIVPGELHLASDIHLSASPVEPGAGVTASATIENTGPVDLPTVDITVRLIDPVEQLIVEEHTHTTPLPAGGIHAFDETLDTTGLGLGRYVVLVTAAGDNGNAPFDLDLASASLELADLSPPTITILEPAGGGVACDAIRIRAEVEDALTRVSRVWTHLDDDPTAIPLRLEDPSVNPTLYSAMRPLPAGIDGAHEIAVHAEDTAGNPSAGEIVTFEADTAPPVLQVTGPIGGGCLSGEVAFVFTAADPHLVTLDAAVDGQPYLSGAPIAIEGEHVFEVVAVDACGRAASDQRSFTIDSTSPDITVTGVSEGGEVLVGSVLEWTASDLHLVTASAALDSVPVISPVTLDVPGPHVLHVTATDCASNFVEVTIHFTVVEAVLSIGGSASAGPPVLEPGDPLALSASATNLGTDLDTVELTLDVVRVASGTVVATISESVPLSAGQTHTITAAPDTSGWSLGAYEIRLTARGVFLGQPFELALATATATLADLTPPQLVLVTPPPGLACQTVEVTAEATDPLTGVSSVAVSIDGGQPVALTNAGGGTWSAILSLDEGPHDLAVVATDGAGNSTPPIAVAVDLDTEPPELTVVAPDPSACVAEPTTLEFSADDAHLESLEATLNGSAIASGQLIDEDGAYELVVTTADACGRQTVDDRDFIVDTVDPELTVTGVEDGGSYALDVPAEWSADDQNLVAASATLDGVAVDPSFTVDTTGPHLLEIIAEDCASNTASQEIDFVVVTAEDGLGGTVTADPLRLEPPEPLAALGAIANLIDTPYPEITLELAILDQAGVVVDSFEATVDLPAGDDAELEHVFATGDLTVGEYRLRFSASGSVYGNSFNVDLASLTFEAVDLTAPTVTIVVPDAGLACDPVDVRAEVHDLLSAIDSVVVHIDGDPEGIPLTHTGGDLWSDNLTLDEGGHLLGVVASDVVGNTSEPATVEIDLDLSPPQLTVEAPADGACTAEPVTITFSVDDAHLDVLRARLDGQPIDTGHAVSDDGDHHLLVSAVDACGRSRTHVADFVIDTMAPRITISGVADGDEVPGPVTVGWAIDETHLVDLVATLDGDPVVSGIVVAATGAHELIIEAADCAGNDERIRIGFTLIEDPWSAVAVHPPSLTSGGSILLLDRSPSGGESLEQWLAGYAGRVSRTDEGCAFVSELRSGRHDLFVLYAPTGAAPLDLASCPSGPAISDVAAELSAVAYRRGGILVLGEGMESEGCLGCLVAAAGSTYRDTVVDVLDVEATTSIVGPVDDLDIVGLRPLDTAGSFPLLVAGSGGRPECDGLRAVTLELAVDLVGPWTVDVRAATPHEALDAETGGLDDEDAIDDSTHPWVDLAAERTGDTLVIELRSTSGGALPNWLAVSARISALGQGSPVESATWLPADCTLLAGRIFDQMEVTGVEVIGHDDLQTTAASARRYGRGEALVLPWDVLAPANVPSLPVAGQAVGFSLPNEPRRPVSGLPLPVTFGVTNTGAVRWTLRIDAEVPAAEFLEAWDEPVTTDPLRWELALGADETAARTVWLLPSPATEVIEIPYTVSVREGDDWVEIAADVVHEVVEPGDRRTALRDLRTSLAACARSTDDADVQAILRDLLTALDGPAQSGNDGRAAATALHELAGAFAAAEDERLPCLAGLRSQVADLIALWQARWVATGDGR